MGGGRAPATGGSCIGGGSGDSCAGSMDPLVGADDIVGHNVVGPPTGTTDNDV